MAFVSWPLIFEGYEFSKTKQGQTFEYHGKDKFRPTKVLEVDEALWKYNL